MLAVISAPDSVAAATAVADGVKNLLVSFDLDPSVIAWLLNYVLAIPTVFLVLLAKYIGKIVPFVSPILHSYLDPWWIANKTWVNPLLALCIGWLLSGNPVVGTIAVFGHQIVSGMKAAAKKSTTAGINRGALGVLLLLLLAAPATAQPVKQEVKLADRFHFSLLAGLKDVAPYGSTTQLYIGARPMFQVSDYVVLQFDIIRPLRGVGDEKLGRRTEYNFALSVPIK